MAALDKRHAEAMAAHSAAHAEAMAALDTRHAEAMAAHAEAMAAHAEQRRALGALIAGMETVIARTGAQGDGRLTAGRWRRSSAGMTASSRTLAPRHGLFIRHGFLAAP